MNRKVFKLIRSLTQILSWLHKSFALAVTRSAKEWEPLVSTFSRVGRQRGAAGLISFVKSVRGNLLNYLSGNCERVPGVALTKDGIPKCLGPLIEIVRRKDPKDSDILKILTTILYSTRSLNTGKVPDINPIVAPPTGVTPAFGSDITKFWNELRYPVNRKVVPRTLRWKRYHFTSNAGPNGHALWTSILDFMTLSLKQLESLRTVGGVKFSTALEVISRGLHLLPSILKRVSRLPLKNRRITYFPDKEDKVRVIAIGDYWTQTVLRPLNRYLFRILKKIPQDCTFNQGSFHHKLPETGTFYSVDLSAATDRFPISVISLVLKGTLPEDYVDSWVDLMVGRPFHHSGSEINYSVGNPMGFYSSWASFTLAHHFLVFHCCQKLGIQWSSAPYTMIGDDIVIADPGLGEEYLALVKSLGIGVSSQKTHKSRDFYEFAKRLFYKGREITPFPISALKESSKRSYLLTQLLIESEIKGWLTKVSIPDSVSEFYGIVLSRPARFRAKQFESSYISERITKVIRGTIPASDCVSQIARQCGYPDLADRFSEEVSLGLLKNTTVELFADSNPENHMSDSPKGPGLGLLAENLVMHFTGFEDPEDMSLGFQIIDCLPHLQAYGLIEEMYINLKREALRIDRDLSGDWPLILRSMTLPLDDRALYMKESHRDALASTIFGKRLISRFEILRQFPQLLA